MSYLSIGIVLLSSFSVVGGRGLAVDYVQAKHQLAQKQGQALLRDAVEPRLLQTTTPKYAARYEGNFQELRGDACFSGPLSIAVACSGDFELTGTSDPSITCEPLTEPLLTAETFFGPATDNGVRCSCGDNCDAFVVKEAGEIYEVGAGGNIFFTCSGNSIADLYSRVVFEPTAGNGCNLAEATAQSHWHILQAGVLCDGEYTYDPFYFECSRGYEAAFELGLLIPTEEFRCVDFGEGCLEGAACKREFDTMVIASDVPNLSAACIETSQTITAAPTPAVPTFSTFSYTSLFSTSWGVRYVDQTSICTSDTPSVVIECGRGSTIERNETASTSTTTTTCTQPSDSSLLCTDSRIGPASNTEFATVEYVCTGPSVPSTTVQFQSTASRCSPDIEIEVASHVLQLGVFCGIFEGYTHSDLYIECDEGGSFASLDEMGELGDRYSCGDIGIFVGGTTAPETTVPAFSASMDNLWLADAHSSCYKFGAAPSGTDPTASPMASGATAPAAASETGAPIVSPTAVSVPTPMSPSLSPQMSSIVSSENPTDAVVVANYKAEYTADFQHVLGDSCEGPPPHIQLFCAGEIRFVSTSTASISCTQLPTSSAIESHPNGLLCTIDCESAGDCDSFVNDLFNIFRMESIVFECSGDRLDDISGLMQVVQSPGTHSCPNTEDGVSQIHIGRLGVSCGTGQTRAVWYDHDLFECILGSGLSFSLENGIRNPGNDLFCGLVDGCTLNESCDCSASGTECPIAIEDIAIVSDVDKFPEDCVQGTATFTTPPSPSPVDPGELKTLLTTRFRTNWSLFNDDAIAATRCEVDLVVAIIQCIRSEVNLLETASSVTCNKESDDILRCSDSGSSFEGDFTSFAEYECVGAGPGVPETIVTLDETSAVCSNNLRAVNIGHSLFLAPFCDSTGFLYVDSLFVECGRGNLFFTPALDVGSRYTCAETANFLVGSSASEPKPLSAASIMTDRQWRDDIFSDCFKAEKLDDSVPTLSPRSSSTASMPTNTGIPPSIMVVTSTPPVSSATGRGINPLAEEKESSPLGVIVGVSVGAVVFLALAGIVLFILVWKKPAREEAKEVQEFAAVNDASETGLSGVSTAHADQAYAYNSAPNPGIPPPETYATAYPMPGTLDQPKAVGENKHGDAGHPQWHQPQQSVSHGSSDLNVSFKDQAQSMIRPSDTNTPNIGEIRPDTIGVPITHDDSASAITEADTRGSSDPSGIYSHERSSIDVNYSMRDRNNDHESSSREQSVDP